MKSSFSNLFAANRAGNNTACTGAARMSAAFGIAFVALAAAPPQAYAGWFENARAYFLAHQYDNAAPCFERALQENPADHRALVYDAACYDRLGQKERARALYQLVMAVFPGTPSAVVAKKGLSNLPAPGAAASPAPAPPAPARAEAGHHSAIHAGDSGSPAAMAATKLAAARSFHEQGKYTEAENNFADALHYAEKCGQYSPQLVDVLQAEGDYYVDRRDYNKAYPFYKRELALRETYQGRDSKAVMDCMMRVAPTYVKMNELEAADQMYRKWLPSLRREYETAINAHKRLTNERNALLGCLNGFLEVLRLTRQKHQSNIRDEFDEISEEIKLLNEEAAKPVQ